MQVMWDDKALEAHIMYPSSVPYLILQRHKFVMSNKHGEFDYEDKIIGTLMNKKHMWRRKSRNEVSLINTFSYSLLVLESLARVIVGKVDVQVEEKMSLLSDVWSDPSLWNLESLGQ